MSRRRWVFVPLVVVALGAAVSASLAAAGVFDSSSRTTPPPAVDPQLAAATACADLARVKELVLANGPADRVLSLLAVAARQATSAALTDPRWLQLASGAQELRDGVRQDNPRLTGQGFGITASICATDHLG
ncbi:MAG: hypothetical protein ACYDB7_03245 [Mycobacteriales bacterium]